MKKLFIAALVASAALAVQAQSQIIIGSLSAAELERQAAQVTIQVFEKTVEVDNSVTLVEVQVCWENQLGFRMCDQPYSEQPAPVASK